MHLIIPHTLTSGSVPKYLELIYIHPGPGSGLPEINDAAFSKRVDWNVLHSYVMMYNDQVLRYHASQGVHVCMSHLLLNYKLPQTKRLKTIHINYTIVSVGHK